MGTKQDPLELTFCPRKIKPLVGGDLYWCLSGSLWGGRLKVKKNLLFGGDLGASGQNGGGNGNWLSLPQVIHSHTLIGHLESARPCAVPPCLCLTIRNSPTS